MRSKGARDCPGTLPLINDCQINDFERMIVHFYCSFLNIFAQCLSGFDLVANCVCGFTTHVNTRERKGETVQCEILYPLPDSGGDGVGLWEQFLA